MSKILLIGYNPPWLEGNTKVEAAHYRTWQFLEPLLDDGHDLCLCANDVDGQEPEPIPEKWANQLQYHKLPFRRQLGWIGQLQKIHDSFNPDCIVAVNFDCSLCATKLRTNKPIWMDIYGDYLTIVQVARYRAGSNRGIPTSIAFVREVLQRGDVFSVCGKPQEHAIVGELAMAGRLNAHSFGYQFAHVVLPGSPPVNGNGTSNKHKPRTLLPQKGVPDDGFVVLWCGGYNTWTDVDTLFAAVECAMEQNPKIHYVSVGANTYEAPDNIYTRLLDKIAQSPYKNRYHMLGWRPWTEVSQYYHESDVGLNIDALHYETIYGTRTRLVEMLAAGLPIITSLGCELSDLIYDHGAGLTFESGDWQAMGKQILTLTQNPDLHHQMSKKALDYAKQGLSFNTTTAALRVWVRNPQPAPDKTPINIHKQLRRLEYQTRSIVRQVIWQLAGLDQV